MSETRLAQFSEIAALCRDDDPDFAVHVVEQLINWASNVGASDLHLNPMADCLEVRIRLDGVLHRAVILPNFAQIKIVILINVLVVFILTKLVPTVKISVWSFPGLTVEGLVLPPMGVSLILTYFISSLLLTFVVGFLKWLFK